MEIFYVVDSLPPLRDHRATVRDKKIAIAIGIGSPNRTAPTPLFLTAPPLTNHFVHLVLFVVPPSAT
jgi:hypothetical protein